MKTMNRLISTSWTAVALAIASLALATSPTEAAGVCQVGVLDTGGINPATGLEWQAGDTYRLVFITSTTTQATSSDIATYNTFVNTVADNSTTYSALGDVNWFIVGSTTTVDARDNTGTNPGSGTGVPVLTMNSVTVAINNADLWNGIANPVSRDENNVYLFEDRAFTGTLFNGTRVTGTGDQPLGSFGTGLGNIRTGRSDNLNWMTDFSNPHTTPNSVFAMSQVLTVIPEPSSVSLLCLAGLSLLRRRRN